MKGPDGEKGATEIVPENVSKIFKTLTSTLQTAKEQMERAYSEANIDPSVDDGIRQAMLHEMLAAQDPMQAIFPQKAMEWPEPTVKKLLDWRAIKRHIDVSSDYDKRFLRALMDAHDNQPEDIASTNAIWALGDVTSILYKKLNPIKRLIEQWEAQGGVRTINDPSVLRAATEVESLYHKLREIGEKTEKQMFAFQQQIKDPVLKESEATRFQDGFTHFLSSAFLDEHFPLKEEE